MPPNSSQYREIRENQLHSTSGAIRTTRSGEYLRVSHPTVRAVLTESTGQDAILRFHFKGPTTKTRKSASGIVIRQICLKLLAMNSCNILYVCWRFEPFEEILITLKANPGKSRHAECGASGYTVLDRVALSRFGVTALDDKSHTLAARLNEAESRLSVNVDGHDVWNDQIDPTSLAGINGPVGFRSDNSVLVFKMLVRS